MRKKELLRRMELAEKLYSQHVSIIKTSRAIRGEEVSKEEIMQSFRINFLETARKSKFL